MKTLSALVSDDRSPIIVGGLTLTERAVLLAHRAGLLPVRVWGERALDPGSEARLRSREISVIQSPSGSTPLADVKDNEGVIVIGANVLVGPSVLTELAGRAGGDAVDTAAAAYEAGVPLLLYVPPGVAADLRPCRSVEAMVARLATRGVVRELPLAGEFCRRVDRANIAPLIEREYIRHLNGNESFFTKQIRRFSVPLTRQLVHLGARPTHVTLGGLALAVASAWYLARGSYLAGLLGAPVLHEHDLRALRHCA